LSRRTLHSFEDETRPSLAALVGAIKLYAMIFHSWIYTTIAYLESMISLKVGGIIVAAFIAGAFVASPELRAYAANTVYSTDIVDGQVKNPDLAGNAVTYSKIAPGSIDGSKIVDQSIKSVDIGPDT